MKISFFPLPAYRQSYGLISGWNFIRLSFFLLLAVGIMLPSDGGHGVLSPKSLAFVGAMFSWMFWIVLHPPVKASTQKLLLFFLSSLFVLFTWIVIGSGNDGLAFDQFKIFLITLSFACMSIYMIQEKCLTFKEFVIFAIGANFIYCLTKTLLAVLHTFHVFNLISLMEKLGLRYMSMEIMGDLGRMQTSVDILTPFILYFVLTSSSWNLSLSKGFKRFYITVAWLSSALSFSRFLLFCALMAHIAFWMTENRKELAASLFKAFLIVMLIIPVVGPEKIYKVVEKRFFSEDNTRSDDVRHEQVHAMMETFEDTPYLGRGLGGYAEKVIRDSRLKYSYEVQWVAFLMQFGLFGMILLLGPIILLLFLILYPPLSRLKASLAVMYMLWILAGFTNPFLISLASGIIYALFYTASQATSCLKQN